MCGLTWNVARWGRAGSGGRRGRRRGTTAVVTRRSPPGEGLCERRVWLRDEMGSPEGEYLLCTSCHGHTTGCVCHSVCRSCGGDDLIRTLPVSWCEEEGDGDAQPL